MAGSSTRPLPSPSPWSPCVCSSWCCWQRGGMGPKMMGTEWDTAREGHYLFNAFFSFLLFYYFISYFSLFFHFYLLLYF